MRIINLYINISICTFYVNTTKYDKMSNVMGLSIGIVGLPNVGTHLHKSYGWVKKYTESEI